jgi:hypothetical protein
MRIPVYVAVAQWALLLALGLLVIIMYRQLGRTLSKAESATTFGPAVGSRAASFEYSRVGDDTVRYLAAGEGQPALVAFVDPTCPACEKLVANLGAADRAGELDGVRVLLLISDPPGYLQISDTFQTTHLEIGRVVARATLDAYDASATPLLVAIDSAGVVRSSGPAIQLSEVRAFSQTCLLPPPDTILEVVPTAPAGGSRPGWPDRPPNQNER